MLWAARLVKHPVGAAVSTSLAAVDGSGSNHLTLQKTPFHARVGAFECLRQDACPSHRGHKVGISSPTRNDMDMDVLFYTCSCRFADVRAHIKRFGMINLAQDC